MAYRQDLKGSARRHLAAAARLHEDSQPGTKPGNRAVAGYLFGLAGELALKHIISDSGMEPLEEDDERGDPIYAHFPKIKTFLLYTAEGRRQGDLLKYARDSSLFREWDIAIRYARTSDISETLTSLWKSQAEALVANMEFS
jgi:hypothetical protein